MAKQKNEDKVTSIKEKLSTTFKNFPTADRLYHDGENVFFSQTKPQMTIITRAEFEKNAGEEITNPNQE